MEIYVHKSLRRLSLLSALVFFFSLSARATPVDQAKLESTMASAMTDVPEFEQIRAEAEKRGLRVWMLGGAAASYAEHAKQNILASEPTARTAWKLDNFLFPEQDVDLVVTHKDGTAETAAEMDDFLHWVEKKFPMKADGKSRWDVIGLKSANPGRKKMALETDPNFLEQHNDSLSLGMVEITEPPKGEKIVKDLGGKADFLKDAAADEMHFIFSPGHESTAYFREGRNPPILSAVRALEKSLRYQKPLDPQSLDTVKQIIHDWNPKEVKPGSYVSNYLNGRAKRIVTHAVNLMDAYRTLHETGLRDKFLQLPGANPAQVESLAWWLSKKPLPPVAKDGIATGKTAGDLGIEHVYHWTSESNHRLITWNYDGSPRAFQSRETHGENAALGEGFYTFVNSPERSRSTQASAKISLKMLVNPAAQEGIDFTLDKRFSPPTAVWKSSWPLKIEHDPAVQYPRNMACSGLFATFGIGNARVTGPLTWKQRLSLNKRVYLNRAVAVGVVGFLGYKTFQGIWKGPHGWSGLLREKGCMDKGSVGKLDGCTLQAHMNSMMAANHIYDAHSYDRNASVDDGTINWIRQGLTNVELQCVVTVAKYRFAKEENLPYREACEGLTAIDEVNLPTNAEDYYRRFGPPPAKNLRFLLRGFRFQ